MPVHGAVRRDDIDCLSDHCLSVCAVLRRSNWHAQAVAGKAIFKKSVSGRHKREGFDHVVNSLLDLQRDRVQDPAVIDMLRESQNRIKSMALIHQTLYESKDFAQVDFSNFLDTLAPTLISSVRTTRTPTLPTTLMCPKISVLSPPKFNMA